MVRAFALAFLLTLLPSPAAAYSGSDHFWYPAINVSATWHWYGCEYGGTAALPAGLNRWGCAPPSNVYLLSHAWSTFRALRTAYHDGTLRVGQYAWFADELGHVTRFRVTWIRRVTAVYLNATASLWALAPSTNEQQIMTLQTCDGSYSQYRIIVRLTQS